MIRGRKRPLEMRDIRSDAALKQAYRDAHFGANLRCLIHNHFNIYRQDPVTGEETQIAHAENVICNQLWTRLFTPATYFNYIHYGTGSGTPAAADTSLFTFLGYGTPATADDVYSSDSDSGYMSLKRKIQLSESTAVGSTLTEVGIGYGTSSSNLVTHAMLKDMNGNQISITKRDTDIINIYATVFVHWTVSGYDSGYIRELYFSNDPNFLKYLLGCGAPTGMFMLFTNGIIPMFYNAISWPSSIPYQTPARSYSVANKTITFTATRLAVSDGNNNGIKKIIISDYNNTYSSGAPAIILEVGGNWFLGSPITGEAIGTGDGITKDFATNFPFVQSGAKIYIDSIEQTDGITVDINTPLKSMDMGQYFQLVEDADNTYQSPVPIGAMSNLTSGRSAVYYNPYYNYGIASFTASLCTVQVSDDMETWVAITSPVSSEYRQKKYWKLTATNTTSGISSMAADTLTPYNIHFTTAPASGAVISADYTTKTIAKDANHVFDFSLVITLGEKTT